jgi:hypothetical protein
VLLANELSLSQTLTHLDLCHNELGDAGACLLLQALRASPVAFCDLSNNKLSSSTTGDFITELLALNKNDTRSASADIGSADTSTADTTARDGGGSTRNSTHNITVCVVLESNQFDDSAVQALRGCGAFL